MEPVPRLSVVIATWNRPRLIHRLVAQLALQTFDRADFEVVVVDDGSTVPVSFAEPSPPLPRVRLIRQQNTGPAVARHQGVLEARGEVILLVDDDMSVDPDFVTAHASLHQPGCRRVVLGQIRPDPEIDRMPLFERFHAEMLERFAADLEAGRIVVAGEHLCTGNVSFPRAEYAAVGGFDASLDRSEDAELGIRFEKAGLELAFSREAFTRHGSDHGSLKVWMTRAFRYGINDRRVGWKHDDRLGASPWRFLFLMNPLARPFLLASAFAPRLGRVLASLGMWCSMRVDALGLHRVGLAGVAVVYGMQYFRGVRYALGSLRRTLVDLRGYTGRRRAAERA